MIKKLAIAAFLLISIGSAHAQTAYPYVYTKSGNFNISWAYDAINLNAANSVNATGSGIKVAVFDSGLNVSNTKFIGNMVTGYNLYCDNGAGCAVVQKDNMWHGTFVSSIICSSVLHGGAK